MFCRAKDDFDIATHRGPKGALVELPDTYAKQLIEQGLFEQVSDERAIAEITQTRETATQPRGRVRRGTDNQNRTSETGDLLR